MNVFSSSKKLKILFVAAEAAPFAKVGGLSSVMYSLPRSLSRLGHDARVMIPRYASITDEENELVLETRALDVPTGSAIDDAGYLICNVKRYDEKKDGTGPVTTYFLENQEYYEFRANVYGYHDDAVRWALLSRGVLEFIRGRSKWIPDIIVIADWQTGLLPNYMRTFYKNDPILSKIITIFSIHNLYYQGMFDHRFVSDMDYDDGHSAIPRFDDPRLLKLNYMRRGIMHADGVNTVSPNYAKEITTKDYGELLDELLRERKNFLTGILNGIDHNAWNPETDPYVVSKFNIKTIEKRQENKTAIQERFGLAKDPNAFLIASVGRLSKQKGFELLYPIMDTVFNELPVQLVVVGEGEPDIMGYFKDLETKYPGRVAAHLKFDSSLPHLVFSGTDVILVPSKFEPCGLTQMEGMRMGAVPIVRKIGGLADSVKDYHPQDDSGTGFVFEKFDSSSLLVALVRAYENFRNKKIWNGIIERAMKKDFSWDKSATKYLEFFERITKGKNHVDESVRVNE